MTKSEAVSWFRIQEMFHFASFHMYGIFAVAIGLGVTGIQIMKRLNVKSVGGKELKLITKRMEVPRLLLGGSLFGLGWALTGACPGPLYVLLGQGIWVVAIVIVSATAGAFVYGLTRHKLPH